MRKITIIQGHPDPAGGHLLHAMADAYVAGAEAAGHTVRRIEVATLDFPVLRSQADFEKGATPRGLLESQDAIRWGEHLVILYPLWLGDMPALLKAFLEQVLRPGFAFDYLPKGKVEMHLKGRSARVVVTMGMPALAYRWFFMAHSLRSLTRNVLKFAGIKPVRWSLYGLVEGRSDKVRQGWIEEMRGLGEIAA